MLESREFWTLMEYSMTKDMLRDLGFEFNVQVDVDSLAKNVEDLLENWI